MSQKRLDPGMGDEAIVRDLVGMTAAQEAAAAELPDLEVALGAPAVGAVIEFNQSVHHGVLGRGLVRSLRQVRRQERRAVGGERISWKS